MASGALGEAAVLKELIRQGYTVFVQFDGQSPFDMVAYKDEELYRVSVKSTSRYYGISYLVELEQRANGSGYKKEFDAINVDILAVYIIPEDRVVLIDPKTVSQKRTLSIRMPNTGNTVDN